MNKMTIEIPGQAPGGQEFVGEVVRIREGVNSCTIIVRNECEVNMGERPEWVKIGAKALIAIDGLTIKPLK